MSYFDTNEVPAQPGGFRRTLTGSLQFVATPQTTMTPDQWRQQVQRAGQRADQTIANSEMVGVMLSESRNMRVTVGGA